MEAGSNVRKAVLLLDSYNDDAKLLHQSFKNIGFQGPVIVINDDGFLPDGVISVYQYFCGDFSNSDIATGKPRYFNQINIPDYWEIIADNGGGTIYNMNKERGRIFYAEPSYRRLVKIVDWYDENGTVRSSDHYNRDGALYARTIFDKDGKKFCKAYFDCNGGEALVENYVTENITVNRDGKVYIINNKVDLVLWVLNDMGLNNHRLFYNSLSTPFFVSQRMPADRKDDILFWQEGERNDIPGNMQMILNGESSRTTAIAVQKAAAYNKLIELGADVDMVKPLGYIYDFVRENQHRNEVLICTNSDHIERLDDVVRAMPDLTFHIAAITEMSAKLMAFSKHSNVKLYPNVSRKKLAELFDSCDYYLDINHEREIVDAIKTAFLNNQLILGFNITVHNKQYIADQHIFADCMSMFKTIREAIDNNDAMESKLELQRMAAMSENGADYFKLFEYNK